MKRSAGVILGHLTVNLFILALLLVFYGLTAAPAAQAVMGSMLKGPVYRGSGENRIALQCVVSWNAAALQSVLETLNARNLKITFLVSGDWALQNEALLRRIALDGHEIGTIGMQPSFDGDLRFIQQDLTDSADTIRRICGVQPVLYYPGERGISVSSVAAERCGMTLVLCTVDLLSARGKIKDIVQRALENPLDGSIILLQPTAAVDAALPEILNAFYEKGIDVVSTGTVISSK